MPRSIKLPSQKRLEELISYYPKTGCAYWRNSSKGRKNDGQAGCMRKDGYVIIPIDGKQYLLHRLIWKLMTGSDPTDLVDHQDNNHRNNRWQNLRNADQAQNHHNCNQRSSNTSGAKGVSFDKSRNLWTARVRTPNTRHYLGRFPTMEEAREVIMRFRSQLHGEFANHG